MRATTLEQAPVGHDRRARGRRRALLVAAAGLGIAGLLGACKRTAPGSPEAVADAFCDAYFRLADQNKAKEFTALGASRMLDREIRDVQALRAEGYTPSQARIEVSVTRGARSSRDERVRFDYTVRFRSHDGVGEKHADVELAKLEGQWKVVRVGLDPSPASTAR
jgi:hypothetical protein